MPDPDEPVRWQRTTLSVDVVERDDAVPTARDKPGSPTRTSRAASPFDPPRRDRFEERGELGRGGMGRVFEAFDSALDRAVAIKQSLTDDDAMQARFEREVRITARLQHPSIVPVLDAGRDEVGRPFYVMRKIEGRPLADVVAEATTLADRLALFPRVMGAVDATAYAHARGIIHRDIKPWNVLLGPFGESLLIDWGIARELDDQEPEAGTTPRPSGNELTRLGSSLGTPGFMPPEQARGERLDRRADVFALGATLAYTLGGEIPKPEPDNPTGELPPDVPSELVAIVGKAMSGERDRRYPDAGALADDLRRFLAGQLVGAHRYTIGELVARWLRRHRVVIAVAAAAVVLLSTFAVLSFRRVVDERDRADLATGEQKARADELVVERAEALVTQEPTAALALLKQLPADSAAWQRAFSVAQTAQAFGAGWGRRVLDLDPTETRPVRLLSSPDVRDLVLVTRSTVWAVDPSLQTPLRELAKVETTSDKISGWIGNKAIAVSDRAGRLVHVDLTSGAKRTIETGGVVTTLLPSAEDGKLVGVVERLRLYAFDPAGGPPTLLASPGQPIFNARRYPGGTVYATERQLWHQPDGAAAQLVREGEHTSLFDVDPAMRRLLSIEKGAIREWQLGTTAEPRDHWQLVVSGVTYANGSPIAVDSGGVVWLNSNGTWSRDRHASLYATLQRDRFLMLSSPNGLIVSMPGSLRIFQLGRSMEIGGRVESQNALAIHGSYLVGVSDSGIVRSWRIEEVMPKVVVDGEGGTPVGWNEDLVWFLTRRKTLLGARLDSSGAFGASSDFGAVQRRCYGPGREVLVSTEPPRRHELVDLRARTRMQLPGEVHGVACSLDASVVALAMPDRLTVIDRRTGELERTIALGTGRTLRQLAVEGNWLAYIDDRELVRVDLETEARTVISIDAVDQLAIEPTGRVSFIRGGTVSMWSGQPTVAPAAIGNLRAAQLISPSAVGLVVMSGDHSVTLVEPGGQVRSYQTGSRTRPSLARKDPFVVITTLDQNVAVLDLRTGSMRRLPWWAESATPSSDGQAVFGVFGDVALVSRSTVPQNITALQAWVDAATNATLARGSTRLTFP